MAHNRYYTIQSDDTNMSDIDQVIVGSADTQRHSIDKSKIVIKLHEEDHHNYSFLSQYTEYNLSDITELLDNSEWINPME